MKNSKSTTFVCPNCGTEVTITTNNCGKSPVDRLRELVSSDKAMSDLVDEIVGKIYGAGYIDVDGIVRRWIPAQCLAMEYGRVGFQQALLMRGYDYSWKVLVNDLKRQAQLVYKHDDEGVADRNRWYNKQVALDMANHFIDKLSEAMTNMPHHLHKNREYIKLKCSLNGGKGVHCDEFQKVFTPLAKAIKKLKSSTAPKTVCDAVVEFDRLRRDIKYRPDSLSPSFINAFKAAGAYYTIKDLIQFEGCKMKLDKDGSTVNREHWCDGKPRKFVSAERSLQALENKAAAIVVRGVCDYGYEMLGLLRDFLSYNEFDYDKTAETWRDQSETRRAVRRALKNRRPRK